MELNLTATFAETLQRYNWSLKCDPAGWNCTIENVNFTGANNTLGGGVGGAEMYPQCPQVQMELSELIFMILYAVVGIVGILGNTLVIYVVLRFSNMQTVTNMYILNLAIADECFLIGIPVSFYSTDEFKLTGK